MKPKLLDLIACPHDHGDLELAPGASEDGGEVVEGELRCASGHAFPIRDSVPRLRPEETPEGDRDQSGTHDTFSEKWDLVENEEWEQLERFQYRWYEDRYGWGDEAKLGEFLAGQEAILDAGTGLGRDTARFARLSRGEAVGMDLSEAVVRAQKQYGSAPNAHYIQGDILNPPFKPETFTFVSSDQVIHHTPDAPRAFQTLAKLLKPEGSIAVYVYKKKALMRELADEVVREQTTKMSVEDCMRFSEAVTELAKKLSDLDAKIELEREIPLMGIESGEHDVQRLIYWTFFKAFWNDDFSWNLNVLVNFDWYHPPYASRHTEDEVRGWADEAGLETTHFDEMESGLSILARRGADAAG